MLKLVEIQRANGKTNGRKTCPELLYIEVPTRVGLLQNLSLDSQSQSQTAAWACFIQNTGPGTALSGGSQLIFPPFQDPSSPVCGPEECGRISQPRTWMETLKQISPTTLSLPKTQCCCWPVRHPPPLSEPSHAASFHLVYNFMCTCHITQICLQNSFV